MSTRRAPCRPAPEWFLAHEGGWLGPPQAFTLSGRQRSRLQGLVQYLIAAEYGQAEALAQLTDAVGRLRCGAGWSRMDVKFTGR